LTAISGSETHYTLSTVYWLVTRLRSSYVQSKR
jgi:hypothetical protein